MANGHVDFGAVKQRTDPHCLGVGSSTYGANPLSSDAQAQAEQDLDARFIRLPVGYRNGRVTTSAAGTSGDLDMPRLVDLYRSWGYRVIAVCGGRTNDRDIQQGDAQRIVEALGFDMIDYTPPNEPDNRGNWTVESVGHAGEWGGQYSITDTAKMVLDDIRRVKGDAKIWGPVWVDERVGETRRYIDIMGPERLAGVDFHRYGAGMNAGPNQKSTQSYFDETGPRFGGMIANVRKDLADRGIGAVYGNVNLDEMNFRWIFENDQRFFQGINTVWMTSALGHVLVNGGKAMPYATQNGALGVMVEQWNNDQGRPASSPMPAYWAIAAFTGAHIWPHYADAFFEASTDDRGVEVFAVNNEAGGYNLVIVNKKEWDDSRLTLDLANVAGGGMTVHQTRKNNPYDRPVVVREGERYGNRIDLTLPACTVTVVVLDPDGATPEPEPGPGPGVVVEPRGEWFIDVGASAAAGAWVDDGGLVDGGTVGSNPGSTDSGETPEFVFDTERWGPQTWTIPVVPGDYDVALLFSERFPGAQAVGGRLFNVDVNGVAVDDVDVWVEQGSVVDGFYGPTFKVSDTDRIVVTLQPGSNGDNPFINGIVVIASDEPAPEVDFSQIRLSYDELLAANTALAESVGTLRAVLTQIEAAQVLIADTTAALGDAIDEADSSNEEL